MKQTNKQTLYCHSDTVMQFAHCACAPMPRPTSCSCSSLFFLLQIYHNHTCQPSRSVGTVPILRPIPDVRPTTQKSRFVPFCPDERPKHDFKPAFCLFSLFFSRNSSFFCVFWPFLMYPVVDSYPNKKSAYIRAFFWLKSSFSCHFPPNARKLDIF